MDGSVISVKDEWSLVVGNFGEKQGVKIGMPLRVVRERPERSPRFEWWMCAQQDLRRGRSGNGF